MRSIGKVRKTVIMGDKIMVAVEKKFRSVNELSIGMMVNREQLSDIYDTYMIIAYEKLSDDIGKLVYIGKERNEQFSSWFKQTKPITPIYNSKEELEDKTVYDE